SRPMARVAKRAVHETGGMRDAGNRAGGVGSYSRKPAFAGDAGGTLLGDACVDIGGGRGRVSTVCEFSRGGNLRRAALSINAFAGGCDLAVVVRCIDGLVARDERRGNQLDFFRSPSCGGTG